MTRLTYTMTASHNTSKMSACYRKYQHSICLKLWIMAFVCSLLCFTCFLIENRRSEIIKSRSIKTKQGAQKLIQLKSSFINEIKKHDMEESSGYYAEGDGISSERAEKYPIDENEPTADSREMLAASNSVLKNSDHFTTAQINSENNVHDYICKSLVEQVEQLLEYPEFSETQSNNMFFDYEAEFPEGHQQTNDYEWVDNLANESDFLQLQLEEDDELNYQLPESENSMRVTWDSEDRFFPDEYAFQTKSSEDIFSAEPRGIVPQKSNDIITEQISPSDIPTMIDTFLGKISTFFVSPMPVKKHDLKHLSNFKDIPLNVEGMRYASSKTHPVRQLHSSEAKAVRRSPLPTTFSVRPRRNHNAKIFGKRREDGTLLPKLLRILRKK